jgi:hypothetical protein
MKKGLRIFVSIIGFLIISLGIWIKVFDNDTHNYYMDGNTISILQGIGKLLLQLVRFVFSIYSLMLIFLIPIMLYKYFGEEDIDFAFYKKWGGFILMVLTGISFVSIAGVQLRNLEEFPNDAKEVIIEKQGTNPVIVKKDYFYFDTTSNDWVEINRMKYNALNSKKTQSTLTYCCEPLGYKLYHGKDNFKFIPNKPRLKYFLFSCEEEIEISKDEFIQFRKRDSLVRYE